jgi:hypothetical protein
MPASRHPRRARLFAVGLLVIGALAAFGSAPAFSYTKIYGSGAALQSLLQKNILIPKSAQLGGFVTFTATTSGGGYKEFGNQLPNPSTPEPSKLRPKEDNTAYPELDAYVATDSGPSTSELENAREAATGSKLSPEENEIAVPVAQTPLDVLLSLPSAVTLNAAQNVDLPGPLTGQLFAGTVPASTDYAANTWGALFEDLGLTKVTSGSPAVGQFLDSGGASTTITVEVRKNGAGTTVNLKQYLPLVDPADWSSFAPTANAYPTSTEWPSSATILPASTGNSTDQVEAAVVDDTPGTVGYATAGDASSNPGVAFTSVPLTSSDGSPASASHQILYALLQDNYTGAAGSRTLPVYADPETNTTGTANIYTGSNIKVNGSSAGGVGSWVIPNSGGTFDAGGTWSGTRASDPDVYEDSGDAIAYYPLVAVAFDLSWSDFSVGNLAGAYANPAAAQETTKAFLSFATSDTGQADILGESYYSPLPSDIGNSSLANIQAVAHTAAGGV